MFFNKIQIVTLCLVLLGLNRVPNTLVIKLVHMTADGVAACAHGMHSAADSVSDSVAAAKAQDRAASAQETAKDVSAALAPAFHAETDAITNAVNQDTAATSAAIAAIGQQKPPVVQQPSLVVWNGYTYVPAR